MCHYEAFDLTERERARESKPEGEEEAAEPVVPADD